MSDEEFNLEQDILKFFNISYDLLLAEDAEDLRSIYNVYFNRLNCIASNIFFKTTNINICDIRMLLNKVPDAFNNVGLANEFEELFDVVWEGFEDAC